MENLWISKGAWRRRSFRAGHSSLIGLSVDSILSHSGASMSTTTTTTTIVGVNLGQPRTPRYHKLSTNSPPPFQINQFHDAHSSIHDAGFTSRSLLHNIASALASQPTLSTLSFNTCHSSSCLQPSRQLTNLCLFVRYFPWRMKETQIRFLQLAVYISEFVLCIPYDDAM